MTMIAPDTACPSAPNLLPEGVREPTRWFRRRRTFILLSVFILLGCLLFEIGRVFLGDNFHEVVPGQVYRGALPSPENLERLVKKHGIRTVVNLRGLCNDLPWYLNE